MGFVDAKSAPRRRPRGPWLVLGAPALLALALGAAAATLTGMNPRWYTPPTAHADAPARAEALERRVLSTLSDTHRFGTTWSISIPDADAAAWTNHRLTAWLANRGVRVAAWEGAGPAAAVAFEPRCARVGLRARVAGVDRVIWARVPMPVAPVLTPGLSGRGQAEGWSFGVGRLALPRPILRVLAPDLQALTDNALRAVAAGPSPPAGALVELTLDDRRRVLVTGVHTEEGRLIISCRTEGGGK